MKKSIKQFFLFFVLGVLGCSNTLGAIPGEPTPYKPLVAPFTEQTSPQPETKDPEQVRREQKRNETIATLCIVGGVVVFFGVEAWLASCDTTSYYALLGIKKKATNDEIEKAYKAQTDALEKKTIPLHEKKEKERLLNLAHETLVSEQRRKTYDELIKYKGLENACLNDFPMTTPEREQHFATESAKLQNAVTQALNKLKQQHPDSPEIATAELELSRILKQSSCAVTRTVDTQYSGNTRIVYTHYTVRGLFAEQIEECNAVLEAIKQHLQLKDAQQQLRTQKENLRQLEVQQQQELSAQSTAANPGDENKNPEPKNAIEGVD